MGERRDREPPQALHIYRTKWQHVWTTEHWGDEEGLVDSGDGDPDTRRAADYLKVLPDYQKARPVLQARARGHYSPRDPVIKVFTARPSDKSSEGEDRRRRSCTNPSFLDNDD